MSHKVKFSRASIRLILSSSLKSCEKEFTLIQGTTYCIGQRVSLPPPAYPEWLESEKEMEALPAAKDWPPGAVAFCQTQSRGKNTDKLLREEHEKGRMQGISLYSHFEAKGFLKKQIVKGQGEIIRVLHFYQIRWWCILLNPKLADRPWLGAPLLTTTTTTTTIIQMRKHSSSNKYFNVGYVLHFYVAEIQTWFN